MGRHLFRPEALTTAESQHQKFHGQNFTAFPSQSSQLNPHVETATFRLSRHGLAVISLSPVYVSDRTPLPFISCFLPDDTHKPQTRVFDLTRGMKLFLSRQSDRDRIDATLWLFPAAISMVSLC